ncbi:MAG TPA: sensor domain-containing diguanylate cyclase [Pyrinomonadaceae bacterium]|nr:sensor domain-containing diguanylate cyclase [Pyrinomonadaceae bacterium]
MRCAEQTIAQLHRYFEDVVLENNLAALVVESLLPESQRSLRDMARVREVGEAARYGFFFVAPDDALTTVPLSDEPSDEKPVLMKKTAQAAFDERFVVIADARFSALLASVRNREGDAAEGDEVIWSFEPDIVYSALEYLMARVTAEIPFQAAAFSRAVRTCVPKTTSLQLTVSVTTKLARLLQEQAVRELAVNRIATAIRSSLELPSILQTTVDEVGRALGAQYSALSVEGEHGQPSLTTCYFRDGAQDDSSRDELVSDMHAYGVRLRGRMKAYVQDGTTDANDPNTRPVAAVPVIYRERTMGVLMVSSDEPQRVWQENEILLMRTVSDQVAVAVNHARLFQQMQQQALTDGLTGCFNRRFFEIQLERDLHLATRMRQPVSLIMLDVDRFKLVNDTHGHDAGDVALRIIAGALREEVRGVDTAARYGGEEFAVILPQANLEGALLVAERLRARIEKTEVPGIGPITASFGVATFPQHASSRELLVTTADRALYQAKRTGRNRVCSPLDLPEFEETHEPVAEAAYETEVSDTFINAEAGDAFASVETGDELAGDAEAAPETLEPQEAATPPSV